MAADRMSAGGKGEPIVGAAVTARGYARWRLVKSTIFWGAIVALSLLAGSQGGLLLWPAGAGLAAGVWLGGRALRDLMEEPLPFEGRVAERRTSRSWDRLIFREERFHLRIERPPDFRPLTLGTGWTVAPGWFLAARGYHDLVEAGDEVSGALHRRTRLIASLVKIRGGGGQGEGARDWGGARDGGGTGDWGGTRG